MGGYKQGYCLLWAEEAEDEERSPDSGRETSEEQGEITRRRCFRSVDFASDCHSKFIPIDKEANHQVMHVIRL
jgi:hypothetical protein